MGWARNPSSYSKKLVLYRKMALRSQSKSISCFLHVKMAMNTDFIELLVDVHTIHRSDCASELSSFHSFRSFFSGSILASLRCILYDVYIVIKFIPMAFCGTSFSTGRCRAEVLLSLGSLIFQLADQFSYRNAGRLQRSHPGHHHNLFLFCISRQWARYSEACANVNTVQTF